MMDVLRALIAAAAMAGGALGWGRLLVRRHGDEEAGQSWIWLDRLALGIGIQGLFVTLLAPVSLSVPVVGILVAIGIVLLLRDEGWKGFWRSLCGGLKCLLEWRLGLVLVCVFVGVVMVAGIAPTTDADTLAYHLDLPLAWTAAGQLISIDRIEAFGPMTVHMIHSAAFLLGGERCVTLVNGIGHVVLMLAALRIGLRFFPEVSWRWMLLAALGLAGAPVLLLALGSGKVEFWLTVWTACGFVRLLAFVDDRALSDAILAGSFLGLCVGSKYYGLISVIGWGVIGLLALVSASQMQRASLFKGAIALGAATAVVGSFWYVRNYAMLGNPLFPAFKSVFPTHVFDETHNALLKDMMALKKPFGRSPLGFVEAMMTVSLVGKGILGPMVAFLGLGLAFGFKGKPIVRPILLFAAVFVAVWYVMAFQRSRHLIPMLAVAVPVGTGCWYLFLARWPRLQSTLRMLMIVGVGAQLAVGALIASQSAAAAVGIEPADELRARTIPGFACVKWANENLQLGDRLLFDRRNHSALLHVDSEQISFFSFRFRVAGIDSRKALLEELRKHDITHVLLVPLPGEEWAHSSPVSREDFSSDVMFHEIRLRRILFDYLLEHGRLEFRSQDTVAQGGRLFGTKTTTDGRVYRLPDLNSVADSH